MHPTLCFDLSLCHRLSNTAVLIPDRVEVLTPTVQQSGNLSKDTWVTNTPVLQLLQHMSAEMASLRRDLDSVKSPQSPATQPREDDILGVRATQVSALPPQHTSTPARRSAGSLMLDSLLNASSSEPPPSASGDQDASRQEKWNQVMGAIKDNLPHMIRSEPSPRKARRIPDRLDPEPKAPPVRMPLHPTITDALTACHKDIKPPKGGDVTKDTPKLTPDRQAPRVFFRPEGFGYFFDAAKLDPNFKELYAPIGPGAQPNLPAHPSSITLTESDVAHREQTARVLLCIESIRRWLEDAALDSAEAMEKDQTTADWGRALAEVIATMRSLSNLVMDRLTTDLVNSLLTRRDMWLRTLVPTPRGKLLK